MVRPGSTIRIPFDTFAAATGAPSALSNFSVSDILIYKDSNTTARASTTGFTATTTFSSVTGLNEIIIDLASDATADFFKAGSRYYVGVSPVTVDGQTLAFWGAVFEIGYPNAVLNTSIATLSSQTSFTLTAGPAEDDALNGMWAVVHDKASAVQLTWVQILDYTGSTKTVTLAAAGTFTIAAIDNFSVMGPTPLQPAVIGRALAVESDGMAYADLREWLGSAPNALTSGRVDVILGAVTAGIITAASFAVSALDAVWSTTTRVLTAATNLTTALATPTNITAGTIGAVTGLTPSTIADQVWDEVLSGHLTSGTTGNALNAAGSAGDPWSTVLPGAYGAGTAGKLVGDNINAPIDTVDTVVDAIKLKTDLIPASPAAVGSAMTLTSGERDAIADAAFLRQMVEAYSADNAAPTMAQAMFELLSLLGEFSISGTTITHKKRDGSTTAFTATLDSASAPTARTRAT
jgi:hypothetical protein